MTRGSDISGFYRLSQEERIRVIADFLGLKREEIPLPHPPPPLPLENSVGYFPVNLGIANYFLIDGKDYFVPMATEEPSVVAAASHGAKIARAGGGFKTYVGEQLMLSQVVITEAKRELDIAQLTDVVSKVADSQMPSVVAAGGGFRGIESEKKGKFLVIKLWIDPADSMGANTLDRVAETLAPLFEEATGGKALLRILSNRVTRRIARAEVAIPAEAVGGSDVAGRIAEASEFAELDEDRAVTHNKGIMNGVTALALATGNDTRALEAAAHSYAAKDGKYSPLSTWKFDGDKLAGRIELPVPVGVVGGSVKSNEVAAFCLRLLRVSKASELGRVMAAVGLAQNLAALMALVTEGIQKGHMRLAARTIAVAAGAQGQLVDIVADELIKRGQIRVDVAKKILESMNQGKRDA
ncbi:MAG: hydroxymethylglutaryl-CoA reductase, degradative [Thermoprotei archaeon]